MWPDVDLQVQLCDSSALSQCVKECVEEVAADEVQLLWDLDVVTSDG